MTKEKKNLRKTMQVYEGHLPPGSKCPLLAVLVMCMVRSSYNHVEDIF